MDQPAINGITALHLASYLGYKDIVNILLKKGATVSQKDVEVPCGHMLLSSSMQLEDTIRKIDLGALITLFIDL